MNRAIDSYEYTLMDDIYDNMTYDDANESYEDYDYGYEDYEDDSAYESYEDYDDGYDYDDALEASKFGKSVSKAWNRDVVKPFKKNVIKPMNRAKNKFLNTTNRDTIRGIKGLMSKLWHGISTMFGKIGSAISSAVEKIRNSAAMQKLREKIASADKTKIAKAGAATAAAIAATVGAVKLMRVIDKKIHAQGKGIDKIKEVPEDDTERCMDAMQIADQKIANARRAREEAAGYRMEGVSTSGMTDEFVNASIGKSASMVTDAAKITAEIAGQVMDGVTPKAWEKCTRSLSNVVHDLMSLVLGRTA